MSHVSVAPDLMTTAAAELATIGSTLDAAHLAAAPTTLAVAPAAADEVSASIAHLFSEHAQDYHAVAREAAAYQEQFVQNLRASAVAYASAEDINAALLEGLQWAASALGSVIFGTIWSEAFIESLPGPLRPYVYLPIVGFFFGAIALGILAGMYQAIISAITG